MQLKSRAATEESKGQTLQKPKKRTAAKNTEALKAVYKRLYAGKVSEDAAGNGEAAQSKQVAMEKAWHLRVKCATSKRGSSCTLAKTAATLQSLKKGTYSADISPLLASSRKGHFQASQCEREAFWKKKPTRAEAIKSRDPEKLYAAEKPRSY